MTLVEFIAPLDKNKHQDRVLAVMYFMERYEGLDALTTDQITRSLKNSRARGAAKVNVADVLNKAGHFANPVGASQKARLWSLTETGRSHVKHLLKLPQSDVEMEHDVGTLETIIAKITDTDVKDYLEESLKCLRVGALRAAVVFSWAATIRAIQTQILSHGSGTATAAIQKHDPKSRTIHRLDDFAYVKDSVALLAAKNLGILDKNEKDTLEEALDLRNRCGHPGKYKPGIKKVSSYIEDISSIVFL